MIQIIGLREFPVRNNPGKTRKSEVFFNMNWRVPDVKRIFTEENWLTQIPEDQRFNLYFTVAECHEERGRKLKEQWCIPFDIDKLEVTADNYLEVAERAARTALASINVNADDCSVIFSGHGAQFFVHLDSPIVDPDFFDRARSAYAGVCARMQDALSKAGIPGVVDTSVFSKGRLMRLPNTLNKKPNQPDRLARVLIAGTTPMAFDLFSLSGVAEVNKGEVVPTAVIKNYPTPDVKAVCEGCSFLKWCKDEPEKVVEPQWYAMLSITANLPNGHKLSHEYSEGHPDYSEYETDEKIAQTLQAAGPRTCKDIESRWDGCSKCDNYGKVTSPIMIRGEDFIPSKDFGFRERKVVEGRVIPGKVAFTDLIKQFEQEFMHVYIEEEDKIMVWDTTHWIPMSPSRVKAWMVKLVVPDATAADIAEFYTRLIYSNVKTREEFIGKSNGCLNFKNVVYNTATGETHPHSHEYGFTYVLPHVYQENAPAPLFTQFLKDITCDDPELIQLILEYIGYSIVDDNCWAQKCLLLVGRGSNGKSVLAETIKELVGSFNTASIFFKDMAKPEARAMLVNKLIAISEETSSTAFAESDVFKQVVTGGSLMVKELYKQPYNTVLRTKFYLLCNEIPRTADRSDGMYRRMMIVPFNAKFTPGDGKHDPYIKDKLVAEAPGIFQMALAAYKVMVDRKMFINPKVSEEKLEEYKQESQPARSMLDDGTLEITGIETDRVTVREMYGAYVETCKADNAKPITYNYFAKTFTNLDNKIGRSRDNTARMFTGVKLKKNF